MTTITHKGSTATLVETTRTSSPEPVLLDVNPAEVDLVQLPGVPAYVYAKLHNLFEITHQAYPWLPTAVTFEAYIQHALWTHAFTASGEERTGQADRD